MSDPKLHPVRRERLDVTNASGEQLAALQWDEFEERIANAVEYDVVPGYDRLYDIYSAAIRDRG